MFCSNCGKTIRLEDNACQHCGASLGEGRFYGNTYTSCQVRIPAEALNDAPEGGMISYTRTNYMTRDIDAAHRQFALDAMEAAGDEPADWIDEPAQDIHTGTVYRPLLSPEEDQARIEREEAEREAEAAAQAEAEAARQQADFEEASDEAESEESAPETDADESVQDEPEDIEPEQPEDEAEDIPEVSTSPLPPLKKAAISPRVLAYMEEMEREKERQANGGGSGFRMPSFLSKLNFGKKNAPGQDEEASGEAAQEEIDESILQAPVYETPEDEETEAEIAAAYDELAAGEETEYGAWPAPAGQTGSDPEADDTESIEDDEFDAPQEEDYTDENGAYYEEYDEANGDEYIAEDDSYASFDEEDEETASGSRFDIAGLLQGFDIRSLLQNRIVTISVAAVLIVAVLTAGIFWLNFVTTKRAKIVDVTYSAYSQGIEMLKSHVAEEYRDSMTQVYLTNTGTANQHFAEDMTALNALMPEEPAANDELFITTLTILQDSIVDAIKADADAELNGTSAARAENSARDWQAIDDAITRLANASTPGELTVIVSNLESVVVPSVAPSAAPTAVPYKTLTNGMMDDLDVKYMQNKLINLGFLDGKADGDFGNGTENAVKAFQRAAGLPADGIATAEVQMAMFAEDAPHAPTSQDTGAVPSDPSAE